MMKGDLSRISHRPNVAFSSKKDNATNRPLFPTDELTSQQWQLQPPKKSLSSITGHVPHQSPLKPSHSFTTIKISRVLSAERCKESQVTSAINAPTHDLWMYPSSNVNNNKNIINIPTESSRLLSAAPVASGSSSGYPHPARTSTNLQPLPSTMNNFTWQTPVVRSPLADNVSPMPRHGPKSDVLYPTKIKHLKSEHIKDHFRKDYIYKSVDSSMNSTIITHSQSAPKSSPINPFSETKPSHSHHYHHEATPNKLKLRTQNTINSTMNSNSTFSSSTATQGNSVYGSSFRGSVPIRSQSSLVAEKSPFLVPPAPSTFSFSSLPNKSKISSSVFSDLGSKTLPNSTLPTLQRVPAVYRTTPLSALKSTRTAYPFVSTPPTHTLHHISQMDTQMTSDVLSRSDDSYSTFGRDSNGIDKNDIESKRLKNKLPYGKYVTLNKSSTLSVSSHPVRNEAARLESKGADVGTVLARPAARKRPDRSDPASVGLAHGTVARNTNSHPTDETKLTPMAVLLSLEGLKAPGHHSANAVKYPNQDRAFIHEISPYFTVFAVFDGHGERGHLVSQFVSSAFQKLLIEDFPSTSDQKDHYALTTSQVFAWMKQAFAKVEIMLIKDSHIDCRYSGSTASLGIRYRNSVLIGYVGDSKVAGFQFHGKKPLCLIETPDHSPSSRQETLRIRKAGATVTETQLQHFSKPISRIVEAGLSLSRALGDLAARQYGVISEPDFIQIDIPPRKMSKGKKKSSHFPLMLVVASDGFWDTIAPYEVLKAITNSQQSKQKLLNAAKQVAEYAWRRRVSAEGRADDTTLIVALLQ